MQQQIVEIKNYLQHKDYSLAVRRLLDTCLDTEKNEFIIKAINCSKQYHQSIASNSFEHFLESTNTIINDLQNTNHIIKNHQTSLLKVNEISKKYNKGNFTLKPISLNIETSKIIGVVGENGNGKTTLLRCLARQLDIDGGSIHYPLLQNPDDFAIKHHIAFIPQRIPRWYGLLKDNLHFSASLSGITGKQNELMVDFMLERLNLTKYAHLNWNQISSGYRTRFEIARILLQKPKLLILDEPLANLDINAQQTILTDLSYIAKSSYNSMGIILSSQQLHEVEKVADSVLFIKQGSAIYNNKKDTEVNKSNVIEFETTQSREAIMNCFLNTQIQLQFNGGYYSLISDTLSASEIIKILIENNITVSYFRDITNSTKRYF